MQIIPTILEKEFSRAEYKIELVKGLVNWVQIDVIDGIYAPEKTFELELLNRRGLEVENFLWNIHLMVKEPIKWIKKCDFINASKVIGQVEMMTDREDFINGLIEQGVEAGLAFDIDTKIDNIPKETDEVLIMGRKAGFEPREFEMKTLEKIVALQKLKEKEELKFKIGVDGGINLENLILLKEKNIDFAYCGAVVFDGNVKENLEKLNNYAG